MSQLSKWLRVNPWQNEVVISVCAWIAAILLASSLIIIVLYAFTNLVPVHSVASKFLPVAAVLGSGLLVATTLHFNMRSKRHETANEEARALSEDIRVGFQQCIQGHAVVFEKVSNLLFSAKPYLTAFRDDFACLHVDHSKLSFAEKVAIENARSRITSMFDLMRGWGFQLPDPNRLLSILAQEELIPDRTPPIGSKDIVSRVTAYAAEQAEREFAEWAINTYLLIEPIRDGLELRCATTYIKRFNRWVEFLATRMIQIEQFLKQLLDRELVSAFGEEGINVLDELTELGRTARAKLAAVGCGGRFAEPDDASLTDTCGDSENLDAG